jgi:hypothetical protein
VAYFSTANNLASGVSGALNQAYWHDRESGTTLIVSVATGREVGNSDCDGDPAAHPALSEDGRFVFFSSSAFNLIPFDVNGVPDVFVRGPLY